MRLLYQSGKLRWLDNTTFADGGPWQLPYVRLYYSAWMDHKGKTVNSFRNWLCNFGQRWNREQSCFTAQKQVVVTAINVETMYMDAEDPLHHPFTQGDKWNISLLVNSFTLVLHLDIVLWYSKIKRNSYNPIKKLYLMTYSIITETKIRIKKYEHMFLLLVLV